VPRGHVYSVSSLQQYIQRVTQIARAWDVTSGYVWYRGVTHASYRLLPGIHWRGIEDEDSLVQDFLINYRPMSDDRVEDPWALYALMQHFGLPTRLLDWSKVPLIALYFALADDPGGQKRIVWVMDPYELNSHAHNFPGVIVPNMAKARDENVSVIDYLPKALRTDDVPPVPQRPLAIEPPLSNRRILFQQGCFTVHGAEPHALETYFPNSRQSHVAKIEIKGASVRKMMLEDLRLLGYKEDYIYQDLGSLAKRLIREREC
jgi:hypothetical protein